MSTLSHKTATIAVNPERLRNDLKSWMLSGIEPSTYKSDLGGVEIGYVFRRGTTKTKAANRDGTDDAVNALICLICDVTADAVIAARRLGATQEGIEEVVKELCIDLGVEWSEVCSGTIELNLVRVSSSVLQFYNFFTRLNVTTNGAMQTSKLQVCKHLVCST